jgi:dethiobiotin synthetase
METRGYFITGSGTGVGKTFVTCALAWQLRQAGREVRALKPVISGYREEDSSSDTALLLECQGFSPSPEHIGLVSPWRFAAPISADMAASREGGAVTLEEVIAHCRLHAVAGGYTLVEGIGGAMSPLNASHTVRDWIEAQEFPAILVCGSYLGAISHALTALEALRLRDIAVASMVVSESEEAPVPLEETLESLRRFAGGVPIIAVSRLGGGMRAYRQAPSLLAMLEKR